MFLPLFSKRRVPVSSDSIDPSRSIFPLIHFNFFLISFSRRPFLLSFSVGYQRFSFTNTGVSIPAVPYHTVPQVLVYRWAAWNEQWSKSYSFSRLLSSNIPTSLSFPFLFACLSPIDLKLMLWQVFKILRLRYSVAAEGGRLQVKPPYECHLSDE